jgi:hypothetical protein
MSRDEKTKPPLCKCGHDREAHEIEPPYYCNECAFDGIGDEAIALPCDCEGYTIPSAESVEPSKPSAPQAPPQAAPTEPLVVRCYKCHGTVIYKRLLNGEIEVWHGCGVASSE